MEERPFWVNQFYAWTVPNARVPEIADRYLTECIRVAKKPFALHASYPSPPVDPINWSRFGWDELETKHLGRIMWGFQQDSLLLTAALYGYHQQHQSYPDKLEELVTDSWIQQLPTDPFTQRDTICYRNEKTSFLLYSRGPDGKDDGGRPISSGLSNKYLLYRVFITSHGDVVYGINKNAESTTSRL